VERVTARMLSLLGDSETVAELPGFNRSYSNEVEGVVGGMYSVKWLICRYWDSM